MSKDEDKFGLTEEELIECIKVLRQWRTKMAKHPEVPDNTAILSLEQHFMNRLREIVTSAYFKEKGLA